MAGLGSGMNACVSGLKGISARTNANAQNLAAAGAIASKSRQAFLTVLNNSESAGSFVPGGIMATNRQFVTEVGTPVESAVGTHLALTGQGFFAVTNSSDDTGETNFTRVGTFEEDKDGKFVNHAGQYLKVFYVNPDGTPIAANTTDIDSLEIASTNGLSGNAVASTEATIRGILSAEAAIGTTVPMTTTVYDSLGIDHPLQLTFTRRALTPAETATNNYSSAWSVTAASPDAAAGGINAAYTTTAPGPMDILFDHVGTIASINGSTAAGTTAPNLQITWTSGANPSDLTMDFGSIGNTNGMRSLGDTTFATPMIVNGNSPGEYKETTIDKDGFMWATFSNGSRQLYARIPLATFTNANQLLEQSQGVFKMTPESGTYTLTFAGTGSAGGMVAGSFEDSTIDTAGVFTDLIVDQQRYTADLQGITTIKAMVEALQRAVQ